MGGPPSQTLPPNPSPTIMLQTPVNSGQSRPNQPQPMPPQAHLQVWPTAAPPGAMPKGMMQPMPPMPMTPGIVTQGVMLAPPIHPPLQQTQQMQQMQQLVAAPVPVKAPPLSRQMQALHNDATNKLRSDSELQTLNKVLKKSCLRKVPVNIGVRAFRNASEDGMISRHKFVEVFRSLMDTHCDNQQKPDEGSIISVFNLFDRERKNLADTTRLLVAMTMFCGGTEMERMKEAFGIFDEDSQLSMDEVFTLITCMFKILFSPPLLRTANWMGSAIQTPEALAGVTVFELFKSTNTAYSEKVCSNKFVQWLTSLCEEDSAIPFMPLRNLLN